MANVKLGRWLSARMRHGYESRQRRVWEPACNPSASMVKVETGARGSDILGICSGEQQGDPISDRIRED